MPQREQDVDKSDCGPDRLRHDRWSSELTERDDFDDAVEGFRRPAVVINPGAGLSFTANSKGWTTKFETRVRFGA